MYIESCPFCGSKNIEIKEDHCSPGDPSTFRAVCQDCFAKGPGQKWNTKVEKVNKQEAIESWNIRSIQWLSDGGV